jgi:cytidylate kinase
MSEPVPVIAIDGPSASGKGTVALAVAERLGFHFLDSGSMYRLVALAAQRKGVDLADEPAVSSLAAGLIARFERGDIFFGGERVTDAIRSEECGHAASRVAAYAGVRGALLERQRAFRQAPGLVADGRDIGTVIFPDALLKVFLTASALERARRRHKQLMAKGMYANLHALLQEIQDRDARDSARSVAPLQQAADARLLDTTALTIDEAVQAVLSMYAEVSARGA